MFNPIAGAAVEKFGAPSVPPLQSPPGNKTIYMTSKGADPDFVNVSREAEPRFLQAVPEPLSIWLSTFAVLVIYGYLYLCMFLGGPFFAFDHQNYIAFLNNPVPFFFEPGYTLLAYLLDAHLPFESRFSLVFLILSLPPLLVVWGSRRRCPRGMILFLCILLKSFYIGFISQRFFFAELWLAALLVRSSQDRVVPWSVALIPGLAIHFSALSVAPSLVWLQAKFSWLKCGLGILAVVALYLLVQASEFRFLNYDYSRYLSDESGLSFSLFTLAQMSALAGICALCLSRFERANFIVLIIILTFAKIAMGHIEVFSRLFQIQTDLIILLVGLRSLSLWTLPLLLFYCLGFLVLQIFFTITANDVGLIHAEAISNVFDAF